MNKNLAIIVISAVVIAAMIVALVGWPSSPTQRGLEALRGKGDQPGAIGVARGELHDAMMLQNLPYYRHTSTREAAPFELEESTATRAGDVEFLHGELNPKAWTLLVAAHNGLSTALANHPQAPADAIADAQCLLAQVISAQGGYCHRQGDLAHRDVLMAITECDTHVGVLADLARLIERQTNAVATENPALLAQIEEAAQEIADAQRELAIRTDERSTLQAEIAALETNITDLREAKAVLDARSLDETIRATDAMAIHEEALVIGDEIYAQQEVLRTKEHDLLMLDQLIEQVQGEMTSAQRRQAEAQEMVDALDRVEAATTPATAARQREWEETHESLMAALEPLTESVQTALTKWREGNEYESQATEMFSRVFGGSDSEAMVLEYKVYSQFAHARAILSERAMLQRLALLRQMMLNADLASSDPAVAAVNALITETGTMEDLTSEAVGLYTAVESDYDAILRLVNRTALEPFQQVGLAETYIHLYDLTGSEGYRTEAELLISEIRLAAEEQDDEDLRAFVRQLQAALAMPISVGRAGVDTSVSAADSDEERIRQVINGLIPAVMNDDLAAFQASFYFGESELADDASQSLFQACRLIVLLEERMEAKFGQGEYAAFLEFVAEEHPTMMFPTLEEMLPMAGSTAPIEINGELATINMDGGMPLYAILIDGQWRLSDSRRAPTEEEITGVMDFFNGVAAMYEAGIEALETAETYNDVMDAMQQAVVEARGG